MYKMTAIFTFLLVFFNQLLFAQWEKMDSLSIATFTFASSGNRLYAGTNTNGFYYSLDSGVTWTPSSQGLNALNIRSIATYDSITIAGCQGGVYRSTNYGHTWYQANNGINGLDICSAIFRGDSLLIGSYGGGVFLSLDYGLNYVPINNGLSDHYVRCLFENNSRIFAGIKYGGGGIFVSDDNGETWVQKVNGVPRSPWNQSKYDDILSFTKSNQSIFASTFNSGVLKSDDNGETWTQLPIDNRAIWTLASHNDTIYSGHNILGVNKSTDNGLTWEQCNTGLIDWDVYSLFIFNSYLFAGTHWGYVFRFQIGEVITNIAYEPIQLSSLVYPNPVTDFSKIVISDLKQQKLTVQIFNIDGRVVDEFSANQNKDILIPRSKLEMGMYIYVIRDEKSRLFSKGKFIVN